MTRATQDERLARQARDQIEYTAGGDAYRSGEPFQPSHSTPWQLGWKAASKRKNGCPP